MSALALPDGWSTKRLKYVATYNDEVLSESTEEDQEIDYVEISGVSLAHGIEEVQRVAFGQAPSRARRRVRTGDILVSTVRTYLRAIAKVDDASPDLIASTGFCVVRPGDGVDSGFIGWAAKSEPFVSEVVARSVGVSYPAINASELVNIQVPLPPLETQRRIAQFLDEKTARIDGLIEKKRALLDRLAEKRQALITRAVTKGLDPAATMKPSGIDWLGEIPAHWEVLPLRRLARKVSTGRTPPSASIDYFTDGEVNWFTPGDFQTGIELHTSARKITSEALEDGVSTLFPEGTVFLVAIGATLGKVAVSMVEGSANQQINAILPEPGNDPHYLAYFLHGFREEVRVTSNGNTLGILNQEGTKSLSVLRPPSSEQREISSELKKHDRREGDVIEAIQRSILSLGEYRAALITAGVTGKIADLQ